MHNSGPRFISLLSHGWTVASTQVITALRSASMNMRFERQDRKSTRLNSSHRCISYAVFCLKKKKKTKQNNSKRNKKLAQKYQTTTYQKPTAIEKNKHTCPPQSTESPATETYDNITVLHNTY